jgi:hypothetical protein
MVSRQSKGVTEEEEFVSQNFEHAAERKIRAHFFPFSWYLTNCAMSFAATASVSASVDEMSKLTRTLRSSARASIPAVVAE